jgi:hypothetical protein
VAPSEDGRNALTREILDCKGDLELMAGLAHLYVYGLIRVCASTWSILHSFAASDFPLVYNPKGPTPAISSEQSPRFSFHQAVEDLQHILHKSSIGTWDLRQLVRMFACFV